MHEYSTTRSSCLIIQMMKHILPESFPMTLKHISKICYSLQCKIEAYCYSVHATQCLRISPCTTCPFLTRDKNVLVYGCLRFFCLGLLVSVLGLYSCLQLSIIAIYRISGTTFTTFGLGLHLQNFLSILEK